MKATGIVRRIDDLGRVVIPKEIRRTMRIREGDPLEIFTEKDGEVIFKKYSPIGELGDFAITYAETLNKTAGIPTLITDRDNIIAVSGISKKELLEKRVSSDIENLMSEKESFKSQGFDSGLSVAEGTDEYNAGVVVPIVSEGDTIGSVIFIMKDSQDPTETEVKLAEAAANFLGRHMEG
ncbi:MAG: stage V sporulation protein T [Clostridia bacterium]|nr:stage V sporulation protein T [Clostridia bacterium]